MNDARDLHDDYAAAGFDGTLGWGARPAVLVVDLCNAYLDPTSPLYAGIEDAAGVAASVVDGARAAGVPVLFTRVEFDPASAAERSVFYRKVPALAAFDAGNPLADWPDGFPSLHPRDGEQVVTKQTASAFSRTDLEARLRALDVDTVVIVGVSTSGCVRATAVDACMADLVPIVVADGVGDRDPRPHEANLFDLAAKYADVLPAADVLDHFRQIADQEGAP